jgi:hypothetical protein
MASRRLLAWSVCCCSVPSLASYLALPRFATSVSTVSMNSLLSFSLMTARLSVQQSATASFSGTDTATVVDSSQASDHLVESGSWSAGSLALPVLACLARFSFPATAGLCIVAVIACNVLQCWPARLAATLQRCNNAPFSPR